MKPMKKIGYAFVLVVFAIFIVYAYRLVVFGRGSSEFVLKRESGASGCAIIVLTGGYGRADAGLALLRKRAGKALILTGVGEKSELDEIFIKTRLKASERESIILDRSATNTYENALASKGAIAALRCDSIVLITSTYHMKRALMIFSKVMAADTVIVPYAVDSPNFDAFVWWKNGGWLLTLGELVKYDYYAMRIVFGL